MGSSEVPFMGPDDREGGTGPVTAPRSYPKSRFGWWGQAELAGVRSGSKESLTIVDIG